MVKVGVVILNWNGWQYTKKCLESLQKINKKDFQVLIIVVDNASTDNSVVNIEKEFPEIKLVGNRKNLGFSEGNNVGIRYALRDTCDFVLLLNNDTTVNSLVIQKLIETSRNHGAGIVSPKIYFSKGFEFHKLRYEQSELGKVIWFAGGIIDWRNVLGYHRGVDEVDKGQFNKTEKIDYATGAGMLVNKSVFEKIGFFDEKFYLYYEDLDFCQRAKMVGEKIYFSPEAVIWHKNAGSSFSGSNLQDYYIVRNRLLFGMKYAPIKAKFALFKEAVKLLFLGRKWQRKGVEDFFLKRFEKGSYG